MVIVMCENCREEFDFNPYFHHDPVTLEIKTENGSLEYMTAYFCKSCEEKGIIDEISRRFNGNGK